MKKRINKNRYYCLSLLICLFITSSCNDSSIEKRQFLDYTQVEGVDSDGFPVDSTVNYFPKSIFTDTVPYYINERGDFINPHRFPKERTKSYIADISTFVDTFRIETDSSYFNYESYALYKLKEPLLSAHYLDKEIYRLIIMRSFAPPAIIRIEKRQDGIFMIEKELNRTITYPFLPHTSFEMEELTASDFENGESLSDYKENKRYNDSIMILFNNTNYYPKVNNERKLSRCDWKKLESALDSVSFWKSKPTIYVNSDQYRIDGSDWMLEGHTRNGYQIKRIPSLHFRRSVYPNNYDPNDCYAQIFKRIFEYSTLTKEL